MIENGVPAPGIEHRRVVTLLETVKGLFACKIEQKFCLSTKVALRNGHCGLLVDYLRWLFYAHQILIYRVSYPQSYIVAIYLTEGEESIIFVTFLTLLSRSRTQ